MTLIRATLAAAALAAGLTTGPAVGADYEVRMLNRGEAGAMVFEPRVLRVEPGETVRFVPVDRGHSTESVDGMVPEGGPTWKGGINEAIEVTFDAEGVYGVLCRPHYSMGMVALVVVGDSLDNLEQARQVRHRGRTQAAFEALFTELEAGH